MKLEKLYTLSQFVDMIRSKQMPHEDRWHFTKGYNDLLKQPRKKEMFVNEITRPSMLTGGYNSFCHSEIGKWEASEKKVIFDNLKFHYIQPSTSPNYWTINGIEIAHEDNRGRFSLDMKYPTLYDLAEATKGELPLKNVEL